MASLFEEMGGTYTLGADGMYYPNLELPEEEAPRYGKYGRMRHNYLLEHKKAYYTTLLFDGKLVAHLNEIDDAANLQMLCAFWFITKTSFNCFKVFCKKLLLQILFYGKKFFIFQQKQC